MARRMYEYLILFDPSKLVGDLLGAVNTLHATFEKHGAEILASRPWAEQRLAYPIQHQKKGLYYLIYARADSSKIHEIDVDLKLNEQVLRFLNIVIDKKWEEEMLAVARDEHALALQLATNVDVTEADFELRRQPIGVNEV